MKKNNDIEGIRRSIDRIDEQVLGLISERGELAKEIGEIKKSEGAKIYVPSRERQIFDRLVKKNFGPYNDVAVRSIFREIISATRALEEPIRVAFLGPEGTFTQMAAVEHFGHAAHFVGAPDISEVFREVETGLADFGVVPIENSTEGVVNYTLDKFVESTLKVCSEVIIPVNLHLLSAEPDLKRIKTVYSHAQALAQCRQWLAMHLPKAKCAHAESTALAAHGIKRKKGAAAIASDFAADQHGLNILAKNIQDVVNNYTRFLVLGDITPAATGHDKTSIAFVAKDRPGILYQLLKPLADRKINLTKIESRPLKTKVWEYMFFVDLDGHVSESNVKTALDELAGECVSFKVLGSYPRAK